MNDHVTRRRVLHLTSPHMRGQDVRDMQWLLAGHDPSVWRKPHVQYPIHYALTLDGEYGPRTANAARGAKHWLGYPDNLVDGDAGPILYGMLTGAIKLPRDYSERRYHRIKQAHTHTNLKARALAVGMTQVGYVETPVNYSKFGAWYGLNPDPWCAMFVSWCYHFAGLHFRYSYVGAINSDAAYGHNGLHLTSSPEPGDLFTIGQAEHVGMFHSWLPGRVLFRTCEGNHMNAVRSDARSRYTVHAFVRVDPRKEG